MNLDVRCDRGCKLASVVVQHPIVSVKNIF